MVTGNPARECYNSCMCMFAGPVNIFARLERGEQFLAYEMVFDSTGENAMVLPHDTRIGALSHRPGV